MHVQADMHTFDNTHMHTNADMHTFDSTYTYIYTQTCTHMTTHTYMSCGHMHACAYTQEAHTRRQAHTLDNTHTQTYTRRRTHTSTHRNHLSYMQTKTHWRTHAKHGLYSSCSGDGVISTAGWGTSSFRLAISFGNSVNPHAFISLTTYVTTTGAKSYHADPLLKLCCTSNTTQEFYYIPARDP